MIYEAWLLGSLVLAFVVTKAVANAKGVGWGIASFFAVVLVSTFAATQLELELDGAGCQTYGHAARDC